MHIFLTSDPSGNVWPYLFSILENSQNLSFTLIHGSTSGFISSYLFFSWPEPPPPEPPPLEPPPLSDYLWQSLFCAGSSTQGWWWWWWYIHHLPPVSAIIRTMPVILSSFLTMAWYCTSVGIPAPVCGFYPRYQLQKDGLLQRPCNIDARNYKCDETILPYISWWILMYQGRPW